MRPRNLKSGRVRKIIYEIPIYNQERGMTRRIVHHTSCAANLRLACIRSVSAGVGAGAGVRNTFSGDLLATVFVGVTCNRVLEPEPLATGPDDVVDDIGPAVLSAEPPIAVGCW